MPTDRDRTRENDDAERQGPASAPPAQENAGPRSGGSLFIQSAPAEERPPSACRWDQYEIWTLVSDRWELACAFPDFELASAVARNRGSRVRLVHAFYEGEEVLERQVIMDVGATREQP